MDEQGYKWDGIKTLKKKFTPKNAKFKDKEGNRIPASQFPQKAAEYLGNQQWGMTEEEERRQENIQWRTDKLPNTDNNGIMPK